MGLGLAVTVATAFFGVVFGCIAGYVGGRVDDLIMRIGDILMAIPYMLLVIAIVIATGRGLEKLVLAISLPWWPWYARIVRGEVIQVRELGYVEAARAIGASRLRVLFSHVFINTLNVVVVQASLQLGRAILAVAAMGFLGLGVQPPQVEWGMMVSIGRTYMPTWWWMASIPGAAIFLLGLGANLLGDGIRDILDPRSLTRR
jgi:peptide/nickel transport system permease protein